MQTELPFAAKAIMALRGTPAQLLPDGKAKRVVWRLSRNQVARIGANRKKMATTGGSPGHAARPRPRPWLGTPLRPVKRMALRGGTGGSLDGRGALARPGPRMRAAFGLTEPPASVIAAPARGSRNLLRPELSSPPRPRGRGRALQATSWTRHPTAKDSEATCGKVWPRKRPREPREDRHPKGRDLRAERTMPPRRSAGSERDGGRRTWGAGTGGAQSSGSGPVQPAHE